jgi:hypothetical protein
MKLRLASIKFNIIFHHCTFNTWILESNKDFAFIWRISTMLYHRDSNQLKRLELKTIKALPETEMYL